MDKNSFRHLLKETASMFTMASDIPNHVENVEGLELYDQISHEVFPDMSYQERSDPVFKRTMLKLMNWKHAMDVRFPCEEDEQAFSAANNIVDFSSFRNNHTARRQVG